jgi:hypothetical protein
LVVFSFFSLLQDLDQPAQHSACEWQQQPEGKQEKSAVT